MTKDPRLLIGLALTAVVFALLLAIVLGGIRI
jgi:hypothetical protein